MVSIHDRVFYVKILNLETWYDETTQAEDQKDVDKVRVINLHSLA